MAKKKKVYTVATAHLDTVWNWDFETTIREYIKATLTKNFMAFEKYPDYNFNFEGAYRYELMEEYYPELFEKLKKYVAAGRWYPCGSSYENGDVNIPSPEALFRNILYGNGYFDKTFGIRSKDIFLPDCFGFGWALPSIMSHANLLGFTTQKLTWGSAHGVPFDLGRWIGVNGEGCYASLKPGGYTSTFKNIRNFAFLKEKLKENEKYGLDMTFLFHGTGDRGGSPNYKSIEVMESEMAQNAAEDVEILSAKADGIYDALEKLSPEDKAKLPVFKDELLMTFHAVGGYTSRAIGKRWNKRNEKLADMAERASVTAELLGAKKYPKEALDKAWKRVIAHQFHDDLPGTSIQKVYQRSFNDYGVSLNRFAGEYAASVKAIAGNMDTLCDGIPVIVHNPLEFHRTEAVEVNISFEGSFVRVLNSEGFEVPSQIVSTDNGKKIIFVSSVLPFSYERYVVLSADKPCVSKNISVGKNFLENAKYRLTINDGGDVSSIFDKKIGKELLAKPIRFALFNYKGSGEYPAWEIPYKELCAPPVAYAGEGKVEITENGAARVAVTVTQKQGKSVFISVISLTNGGEIVEVKNRIDWRSPRKLLKKEFCLSAKNELATYDLGIGAIKRGNSTEKLYEVPAQDWADITDEGGDYGISVLSDCKYGWDKPKDDTLRLTVLHTPYYDFRFDSVQSKMDLGLNLFGYGIYSHEDGVGKGTHKAGKSFNYPMTAFVCDRHTGNLGTRFTAAELSDDGISVSALKKAQNGEEIVVRFFEKENVEHKGVFFGLNREIIGAREIYASEESIGGAYLENGRLKFDVSPYGVKSFALTVKPEKLAESRQIRVKLPYNSPLTTDNAHRNESFIEGTSFSLPKELWKEELTVCGIGFDLGEVTLCKGQKIELPEDTQTLYIIASSLKKDKQVDFYAEDKKISLSVASCFERIARWDMVGLKETANVKTDAAADVITHVHAKDGDALAKCFTLFCYELKVDGERTLKLPDDPDIALFAMTASRDKNLCIPGAELYDVEKERVFDYTEDAVEKRRSLFRAFRHYFLRKDYIQNI